MPEEKGKKWVNFQELKASISFEQVLDLLGLMAALERAGDEVRGQCPICKRGDEKSKSFSINISKQVFQCFACKRKGNVLDFTAAVRGSDVHHAALWLRETLLDNKEGQADVQQSVAASRPAGSEVQERVQMDVSGNGAGEVQEAGGVEEMPTRAVEGLTEREAWLARIVARGVAWYLSETFRPLGDVETIEKCILAKVEMVAAAAGEGNAVSAEADIPHGLLYFYE